MGELLLNPDALPGIPQSEVEILNNNEIKKSIFLSKID